MNREEAIEWMVFQKEQVLAMSGDKSGTLTVAYDMAIEALEQEPVKHGKWINKRLTKDSIKDIKDGTYGELIGYHDICSVCGFDIDEFWCATGSPNYCPNCGAKMIRR